MKLCVEGRGTYIDDRESLHGRFCVPEMRVGVAQRILQKALDARCQGRGARIGEGLVRQRGAEQELLEGVRGDPGGYQLYDAFAGVGRMRGVSSENA